MRKAALLAALGIATAACSARPQAPNLLLITIDTLRADRCSIYGYSRPTTPHIDRLAREGAMFDLAYAPMATTAPSHATLFTSLCPASHGLLRNGMRLGDQLTLAKALRRAGYRTAAVISSYVLKRQFGFGQGFGTYQEDFGSARPGEHDSWEGEEVTGAFDRTADITTDRALAWLEARQTDKPFFLWVHYFDPHHPYAPPEPYLTRFRASHPDSPVAVANAAYDGEVAFTDAQLGRLVQRMEKTGDLSNTLLVLTSDHGEGLMQHGHMGHGLQLYEEAVRVPLVVRWPGRVSAGLRVRGPVELLDLMPTVLDLLGVKLTETSVQGRSLAKALTGQGPAPDPDHPTFFERRFYQTPVVGSVRVSGSKYGVRAGRFKYIEAREETTRELFDLDRDPGERDNIADRQASTADGLSRAIAAWRRARADRRAETDRSPETEAALRALGYVQ